MKKTIPLISCICIIFTSTYCQTTESLKGVTFGIGTGFSTLFKRPHEYSLSTDANHILKLQKMDKLSFVISSAIIIKFGKLGVEAPQSPQGTKRIVNMNNPLGKVNALGAPIYSDAKPWQRLSLNVALNLLELNSENLSFNKSIDGGLGLGYFVNDFTQVSLFLDLIRIRQLRDFIIANYSEKPIPNGTEYYNALDNNDSKLFYNKSFGGVSFKIVFSLGNRN